MFSNVVSWGTMRARYVVPLLPWVFLIHASLIKQHSRRTLRQQVPLLMCALIGTTFSKDMLQIQMCQLERPFLE